MIHTDKPRLIASHPAVHWRFLRFRFPMGWTAWGLVAALLVLYFIPYLFVPFDRLGIYAAVVCVPVLCAAFLLAYRGCLLAWACSFGCMLLFRRMQGDQLWSAHIVIDQIFPSLLVLLIGLVVARMTAVSRALRGLHRRLSEAHRELTIALAAVQVQALTDPLTGLPNHRAIMDRFEAEIQRCQLSQRNCAIIFADVDHFKRVNDTWGHAAGDFVLSSIGHILQATLRHQDYVGRYGGEEFAILLADIEQEEAFNLAERLRCSIAETPCLWQYGETPQAVTPIPLTASFGLATYPLDGLTARELLDVADAAMYTAKHTGRNRVCLPDEVEAAALTGEQEHQLPRYSEQSVLQTMATMTTWHDRDTQAHANRMIRLAEATMRALGRSEEEVVLLRLAAQVHDIGKIGIPQAILQKPSSLSEEEWDVMHRHPQIGQQILAQAKGYFGLVSHIIVAHHERWDGQGYPYRLAGQEIPLGARILCVIDAYDAMTSSRPYREALPAAAARAELQRCAGTQFDPQVVDVFLQVLQAHEPPTSIALAPASL